MIKIWVVYKPTLESTIRTHVSDPSLYTNIRYLSILEPLPNHETPELIMSVGGDGTFLTAARYAHKFKCPIMGFHAGTLGFLAMWDITDPYFIQKGIETWLTSYVEEKKLIELFDISHRHLVRCEVGDQHWSALNEWVVSPQDPDRILTYDAYIGHSDAHDYAGQHKANGVIVASATGSTAYTLSVNGALMDPENSTMLQIAPIAPLSLTSRPLIIGDDAHVHIVVSATEDKPVVVKGDGQHALTLTKNTKIRFVSHHRPITVLQPKNTNFYNTLTEKMHWNVHVNNRIVTEDQE